MPLYEYQCDACGTRFELIQKFSDPPAGACPSCKGPVRKLLSSPAIQFKGSGWYVTDYARKGARASSDNGVAATTKDGSKDTDGKAAKASDKKPQRGTKTESSATSAD